MTSAIIPGLDTAPTEHEGLLAWVAEVAELTQPDRVVFADGSDEEFLRLSDLLVEAGTFTKLNESTHPTSYLARSAPSDVAGSNRGHLLRAEIDAGPTNNWMDPAEMRSIMTGLYRGCMRGRTMYVVPFCMGPLGAEDPKLGVEITDSEYVVVSMRTMTRMGRAALDKIGTDGFFVKALHSLGAPLEEVRRMLPGRATTPNTSSFPRDPRDLELWFRIWGQRLLGKMLFAADRLGDGARRVGWPSTC